MLLELLNDQRRGKYGSQIPFSYVPNNSLRPTTLTLITIPILVMRPN